MSTRPREDASLPVVVAPSKFCPRKLKPGMVKRYMHTGPLVGYMVACPSCGFISLHLHEHGHFVDRVDVNDPVPVVLISMAPVACMLCHRFIEVRDGVVHATRQLQMAQVSSEGM